MPDSLRIVRIFIGSPGGLTEERQAAHAVVNGVNRSHSEHWGVHFKLLGWEDAVPGYARPQSKINEDLDKCDYFIGVLWNHWGSRPSADADGYSSGFEEEYFRAEGRIQKGLMRDMALYFKTVEIPDGMEPGEPIKKVLEFRHKCIEEKRIFFKDFIDVAAFKDAVRDKLEEIGWREAVSAPGAVPEISQPDKNAGSVDEQNTPPPASGRLFGDATRQFLSEMLERSSDWDSTSSYEVARLRLVASTLSRSGNDELHIGNHDANLFFQYYREQNISEEELLALIDCGVAGYQVQNVPLWRWISKLDGDQWRRIRILSWFGTENEKRNAIKILDVASQPVPTDAHIDKATVLEFWLSDDVPESVFDSAIDYLSNNSSIDDATAIEQVALTCTPARKAKIGQALAAILSRSSAERALIYIIEQNVDRVHDNVYRRLFAQPSTITTSTAHLCLSAKPDQIRLGAAQLLLRRKEMELSSAEALLTDSNHEIRLVAAESLNMLGVQLDDAALKKALQVVRANRHSLSGLFATSETDDTYYHRYRMNRIRELAVEDLVQLVSRMGVFDQDELGVLYSKSPRKNAANIRKNLADSFSEYFNARLQQGVEQGTINSDLEKRIRGLEDFLRSQICGSALSTLCKVRDAKDIGLVRKTVDEHKIEATDAILNYLAKFGGWEDIQRINNLAPKVRPSRSILDITPMTQPTQKAIAILELGQERVADLFQLDLPRLIRIELVRNLSLRRFAAMSDDNIIGELENDDAEYRITVAAKCVQALSKARIARLLNRYVDSSSHRYYNSVHWLDLGASMVTSIAKTVARRKLENSDASVQSWLTA